MSIGTEKRRGAGGDRKAEKARRRAGRPISPRGSGPAVVAPRPLPESPDAGPDFFCIGAQKGGTRWLYDQLQLHPDFWMPPVKELHYFDRRRPSDTSVSLERRATRHFSGTNRRRTRAALRPLDQRDIDFLAAYVRMRWWRTDLEAYARLFTLKGDLLSGDITPDYSTLPSRTIGRIVARFPKARVVFIARDPVERAWSHLVMHMQRGEIDRDIDADAVMRLVRKRFVASRSYPTEIVARWRRHVPEAQFGLFLFDDLIADAEDFRRRILAFLGADPRKGSGVIPPGFNRKENPEKVRLSPAIRERLGRHFAAELKACGEHFGGAAKGWAAKYGL